MSRISYSAAALAAAAVLLPGIARADVKLVTDINLTGVPAALVPGLGASGIKSTGAEYTVTTSLKDDKARVDMGSTSLVYNTTTDTLYKLDTKNKTYSLSHPKAEGAARVAQAAASSPFAAYAQYVKVNEVKTALDDSGASLTRAGRPAKQATFSVAVSAGPSSEDYAAYVPDVALNMKGEQWNARDLSLPAPLQTLVQSTTAQVLSLPAFGEKSSLSPLRDFINRLVSLPGIALYRRADVTITTSGPAAASFPSLAKPITYSEEVKTISEDTLPDALFAPPADYKQVAAPASAAKP